VTLQWAAPSGRVQAADGTLAQLQGYQIYRYTNSDPSPKLIAQTSPTNTQYVDQGLSAAQSYTYAIYAYDPYGVGKAADVYVAGSGGAMGGCSSTGSVAPLGLAGVIALLRRSWRRRKG
jgi:hypothetical protein